MSRYLTKAEKLKAVRKRLDKKLGETTKAQAEVTKETITAIFEKLGHKTHVPINNPSHSHNNLKVSFNDYLTCYELELTVRRLKLSGIVRDETDPDLELFARMEQLK